MDDSSGDKRSSNLARIRDNQRRSRARRKEYLQELETRYRHCEQTGVEASAEIQAAARKVVDENRRLRELLRQHGLSDAEIDTSPSDTRDSNLSNELESMLGTRKRCGGGVCDDGTICEPSPDTNTNSTARMPLAPNQNAIHLPAIKPTTTLSPATQLPALPDFSQIPVVDPSLSYTPSDYTLHPMDYYDDHAHLPPGGVPSLSHSGSSMDSSTRTASDAEIRAAQQEFDLHLEQDGCCGAGVQCRVSNDCIYKIMEQYSEQS